MKSTYKPVAVAYRDGMLLAVSTMLGWTSVARAAETAEVETRAAIVAEIIVTAQRREIRALDTPISITAFNAETIADNRLLRLDDISSLAPGVTFIPITPSNTYMTIRGTTIGDDAPGNEQGVALFIDDVVSTGTADMQPDLFDVERIEVLRGPQGTLFGRNVTGGAIAIYNRRPSHESEVRAEITGGSDDLMEGKVLLGGSLHDDIAGRFSASYTKYDGDVESTVTGRPVGGREFYNLRGQLLFSPADNFDFTLGVDYLDEDSPPIVQRIIGDFQPVLFPGLTYDPDKSSAAPTDAGRNERNIVAITGRADWETAAGTLSSISGYRDVSVDTSSIGLPAPSGNQVIPSEDQQDEQFSQELRFASKQMGRVSWIAGLYYLHADKERRTPYAFDMNPLNDLIFGTEAAFGFAFPVPPQFTTIWEQNVTVRSAAVFGEAMIDLTDTLQLTLGGRYTRDEKSGSSYKSEAALIPLPPAFGGGVVTASLDESWAEFTPRAILSYKPVRDTTLFVSASRGYKSGGFNLAGLTADALATPFDPEYVWSYEAGAKFLTWDQRLHGSVSAFHADWTDMQVLIFEPASLSFTTTNAGTAKIQGVEIELQADLSNWLTVGVNYDYTEATFEEYIDPLANADYSGNDIPFTPRNHVVLSADLHWPVNPWGAMLSFGGTFTERSAVEVAPNNADPKFFTDQTKIDGVLNLHLTLADDDERWKVSLWAKNVTDERYLVETHSVTSYYRSFLAGETSGNIYTAVWNPGRTFGVTLSGSW
jgi:iron complex outermembrane recepter protein